MLNTLDARVMQKMDRAWMYNRVGSNRRYLTNEFLRGVEEFMRKAMDV